MKRILYVCLSLFLLVSCEVLENVELKAENNLIETIPVRIAQTTNIAELFDFTNTINIHSGDFVQYKDKVTALQISVISYKFIDFKGDNNGSISSGNLKLDAVEIAKMTDVNISTASAEGTVFKVTDVAKLNQVASSFLDDSDVIVSLKGAVLSEAASMDFKVEVRIEMMATLKE